MKNHCVSLELARKLVKAEWKKPTKFIWSKNHYGVLEYGKPPELFEGSYRIIDVAPIADKNSDLPAPLATEILEELPTKISLCAFYVKTEYRCVDNDVHRNAPTEVSFNPCDALAKMWLSLREKKEV